MIDIGTILQNRYRIEKQIGQGGMGKVYVASDQRFNSTVAIKETVFEDKNLRKAFEREARLLNSLKHQALPRVSDHFTEGTGQFLVMEYIAGEDLAEMMVRNDEAFPLENVLNWANQLCDALDYLHAQDIIHRDIKPQNLKLTPGGQIVLLDFGLAKGNPTDAPHHTAAKSIFGYSRSYASLEQIQGTGTEPRSDLYSLAATLYHLLTGIPPADALTRAMNVLNGQPDPLIPANLINVRVPRGVGEILLQTMALNANERPISATSLREMLAASDMSIDAGAINVVPNSFTGDLLTQETEIKSPTTNVLSFDKSSGKTAEPAKSGSPANPFETRLINSGDDSKLTNIRPAAEITTSPKPSRRLGASLAAGLLLVGTAISAAILLNPGGARNNVETVPVNTEFKTSFVNAVSENPAVSIQNAANQNSDLTIKENNTKPQEKHPALKPSETVRNNSKERKNPAISAQTAENSNHPEIKMGDVVIKNERIETKNMIIDENGFRMKKIPPVPLRNRIDPKSGHPLPPEVYRVLTPEQIREIEQLKKMKPQVVIVGTPKPIPSPKQTP